MKIKIILGAVLFNFLIGGTSAYAIEKNDIHKETLKSWDISKEHSQSLYNFLSIYGISETQYNNYMQYFGGNDIYNECEEWYKLDSGMIFYDELLFSHPKKQELNTSNDTTIKKAVKKELLASIDSIESYLQESIDKKYCDIESIYKKIFNIEPSTKEKEWLKKLDTLKYAAYSGNLKRTITDDEITLINQGNGHEIISGFRTETEKDEFSYIYHNYADAIEYNKELEKYAILYYQIYESFLDIREIIHFVFNIDIFDVITDNERLSIYKNSETGLRFDEIKALKNTLDLLVEKGLIELDSTTAPDDSEESDQNHSQKDNPILSINKFIKNNKLFKIDISKMFLKSINNDYDYENTIAFKYKDKEYKTTIKYKDGVVSENDLKSLITVISKSLKCKSVESKNKIMIHLNDKLTIVDAKNNSSENNKKEVKFDDLRNSLKEINIQLYIYK